MGFVSLAMTPRANLKEKVVFSGNPQPSSPEKHTAPPCLCNRLLLQSPENKVPTQSVTSTNLLFIGMLFSTEVRYVAQVSLQLPALEVQYRFVPQRPALPIIVKGSV